MAGTTDTDISIRILKEQVLARKSRPADYAQAKLCARKGSLSKLRVIQNYALYKTTPYTELHGVCGRVYSYK